MGSDNKKKSTKNKKMDRRGFSFQAYQARPQAESARAVWGLKDPDSERKG
jgi:hypothetical protein